MDELLVKKLTRQLRVLNIWLTVMTVLVLVSFAVVLFMLFKVYTFVQDTSQQIDNIQTKAKDSLDIRRQLCSKDAVSDFLGDKSEVCRAQ